MGAQTVCMRTLTHLSPLPPPWSARPKKSFFTKQKVKGAVPEKCFHCQCFVRNFQGLVQLVPFYQVSVEISFAKTWSHIHPGGTSSTSCHKGFESEKVKKKDF